MAKRKSEIVVDEFPHRFRIQRFNAAGECMETSYTSTQFRANEEAGRMSTHEQPIVHVKHKPHKGKQSSR